MVFPHPIQEKQMKRLVLLLGFLAPVAGYAIETVDEVDLERYAGRWYQIARNPTWFEPRNCVCAQQTLTLRDDGDVDVYNSCRVRTPRGGLQDISGTASVVDTDSNAKLSVDFGMPWKGTYWIIGLDSDYRWAAVTDRRGRTLYILSKTPTLSDDLYEAAVAAAAKEVNTDRLLETDHTGCRYP
jgi:apolipoprotein D and lipocalin family protein